MKLDSFGCRTLSKAIIDFLYFVFTSNFKGNSYLDEKESIIGAIEIKKVNEFKLQENLLSELIRYLNKIYEKKIEGDGYAHPLLEFSVLNSLLGIGYENIINLFKKLNLSLLFKKYNEYYELKAKEKDTKNITDEIMYILPEIRDNFLQLIRDYK